MYSKNLIKLNERISREENILKGCKRELRRLERLQRIYVLKQGGVKNV